MKLRKDIDYIQFLDTVNQCKKDVIFKTSEGDCLNLASTLSRLLFAAVSSYDAIVKNGEVECLCREDQERLENFLKN